MIIACAVNHFQQLLRHVSWRRHPWSRSTLNTCQKMNFSWIFQKRFSKYYQIPGFIHIYSHLPKKSSMKNFNFELQYSIRDPFHRNCHYLKNVRVWSFMVRIFRNLDWIRKEPSISPYSVRIREYTDQKNCEYGHFSRNV